MPSAYWSFSATSFKIPFFALISARAKRRETLLLKVCAVILVGHWIDLFGIILPPVIASPDSSVLWSIAPTLALLPLLLMHYVLSLRKAPLVPLHDPMLIESLHHH